MKLRPLSDRIDDGTYADLGCKPGDTVLFGKYQGSEISLAGESLLVVRADDILGVIESDA